MILEYLKQLPWTILDNYLRLSEIKILDYHKNYLKLLPPPPVSNNVENIDLNIFCRNNMEMVLKIPFVNFIEGSEKYPNKIGQGIVGNPSYITPRFCENNIDAKLMIF